MFPGKRLVFLSLLLSALLPSLSAAQSRSMASVPDLQSKSRWLVGGSYALFDEKLVLRQAGFSGESMANYQGYAIFAEKFYFLNSALWSLGFESSMGYANTGGGGGEFFTYEKNRQAWWSFAPYGRYAFRLSNQVSFGLRMGPIYKNVTWPSLETNVNVQRSNELGFLALAELGLRFGKWEIQQGLGAFGMGSGSYWRLAVGYIL